MATSAHTGGDFDEDPPSTARECATRAIENSDESVKPAELADEYGCSSGHMRNILRELMNEGEVVRVDRGEYADASAADVEMEAEDTGEDSSEFDAPAAAESVEEEMATEEEYQEQHDLDRDESDGEEEEVSDDQDDEKPAIKEEDIADVEAANGAAGAAAAGAAGLSLLGDRDGVNVWLIVGVVALGLLVYMMVSGGDTEEVEETEEEPDEETVQQSGGGLRG